MKNLTLFAALAALVVVGCSQPDEKAAAPANAAQDEQAGAAGRDDRTWSRDSNGLEGRARLVYAAPGQADFGVKFECPEGGPVYVFTSDTPAEGATAFPFVLTSGEAVIAMTGGVYDGQVSAAAPSNSFTIIRTTGVLSVGPQGGPAVEMNAINDQERTVINEFFEICGA